MNYQRLYQYRFRNVPQERREDIWGVIADFLYAQLGAPATLLDPAAGRCEFINNAPAPERWAVDAQDYSAFAGDGVRFVESDIMTADLPADYFGGVFASNFLEHLPSQEAVAAFLERMFRCTRPGGRIAIMGPNFRYCSGVYFDFADHSVVLTHKGVEEHLYAAGFDIVAVHPQFLPFSFTGRLPAAPALVRWYLHLPLAWRVLGKQFLVIGQRPAGD